MMKNGEIKAISAYLGYDRIHENEIGFSTLLPHSNVGFNIESKSQTINRVADVYLDSTSYMQEEVNKCIGIISQSSIFMNSILSLYSNYEMINSDKAKAIETINEFKLLKYDWNENGANPFSIQLIDKAKNIVKRLNYIPDVFPVANNSIQLEYEKENDEYLEFEIYEDKIKYYRVFENGNDEEDLILGNDYLKSINEMVTDFYGI